MRHTVLQLNLRISYHVFILSVRKIVSRTHFLASAGAVKILMLFSVSKDKKVIVLQHVFVTYSEI